MRTVLVGGVFAIASCFTLQAGVPTALAQEPWSTGRPPAADNGVAKLLDDGARAAPASGIPRARTEGGATTFVKALGLLRSPRITAAGGGVAIAASGACGDERGRLATGIGEPASFIVVAKLGDDGTRIWTRTFFGPCPRTQRDGEPSHIAGIAADRIGNIYVAGDLTAESSPVDLGTGPLTAAGGHDVFVASFDAAGKPRWSKRFGDGADQRAGSLAVSSEGLVAITGSFEGSVDFGGGIFSSTGKSDTFVAVFDSAGQHLASHAFGDAGDQRGELIVFGSHGDLTVAGRYESTMDFGGGRLPVSHIGRTFVTHYMDNGAGSSPRFALAYAKALPPDVTVGALAGATDGVYVAGSFRGTADFGSVALKAHDPDDKNAPVSDAYVLKLDRAGKYVFGRTFGLGGVHHIEGLALANDLWMAGEFSGATKFADTMVSAGGSDGLLVRLDPDGGEAKAAWRFGDTFTQNVIGSAWGASSPLLYLLAQNNGTIDFGTGPQSEHGAFLVGFAFEPMARTAFRPVDVPKSDHNGDIR